MLLTVLATFTSSGKAYKPGEIVGVTNGLVLVDPGYAPTPAKEEERVISDRYARYVEALFKDMSLRGKNQRPHMLRAVYSNLFHQRRSCHG